MSRILPVTRRRAAKYRRISRDREGRALGIQRQDEDLDALAERLDLDVTADYFDNDISASTISKKLRYGYQQMLIDAREGKFDVIIAYTTGRLTRRPREFEDLVDLATGHGIEFEYVRSPSFDLRTSQGRRIARTLAVQDAAEAEDIAERVGRQKLQAATSGRWKGGRRPLGYEADGVTVRPAEAAAILRACEEVLAGASMNSVTARATARGLTTSTGRPLEPEDFRRVLLRPRNAGLMEHRREVIGPAEWPAIVPETIWRGVCAVLRDPDRRTQLSSARRWLGTGLYLCGVCDNGATVHAFKGGAHARPGVRPAYVCSPVRHLSRVAEEVDRYVMAVLRERLSRADARDLGSAPAVDLAALYIEKEAIREQLTELAGMYARRAITGAQLEAASADLRGQLADLEQRETDSSRGSTLRGVTADRLDDYDLDRRRAIIAELMTVTLMPSRRGRRPGWRPGESYFDPTTVAISWR